MTDRGIRRRYSINVSGDRSIPKDILIGDAWCTPLDAARNYAGIYMDGWEVRSCRYVCIKNTKSDGVHAFYIAELSDGGSETKYMHVREIDSD